ncbi:MAG TPA: tetratricopeptide repeat protein [Verrucomicrobiae bacterium]|nr:tetratricopeptide repeat protein [Verrucomicrobiae bacterium]
MALLIFGLTSSHTLLANTNDLASYDEAVRLNPRDAKSYIDRGAALLQKQDALRAFSDFDQAIELEPNNATGYAYRGACYSLNNQWDQASADYSKAIQLDTTNAAHYFNRSSARWKLGELDGALLDLSECLRLNPDFAAAYKSFASILEIKGAFESAITNWNKYLMVGSQDANAFARRAFCRTRKKDYYHAVKDYEEAIRLDAKNHYSLNSLGWLRATCPDASVRDGIEATALARRACQITGWSRWTHLDTLAAAYAETGDFKQAIHTQEQAMDITGLSDDEHKDLLSRLKLYQQRKPYREMQTQ